ncbi:MAG TPA: hypothetical protein VGA71_13405, partial [Actinomycetota bacterium]
MARAVEPMRTIMGTDSFEAGLASRRAPHLLVGPLSHALSAGAPSGMIHGIARVGPPPKPVHVGGTSPAAAPSPRSLRTVMRFPGRSSIPSIRGTAGSPEPAAAEPGPVAAPVAEPSPVGVEGIRVAPPPDQADVPLMTLGEPLVQPASGPVVQATSEPAPSMTTAGAVRLPSLVLAPPPSTAVSTSPRAGTNPTREAPDQPEGELEAPGSVPLIGDAPTVAAGDPAAREEPSADLTQPPLASPPLGVWRSAEGTQTPASSAPVPSPVVMPPALPPRRRLRLGEPLRSLPSIPAPGRAPGTPQPSPAPFLQRLAARPPVVPEAVDRPVLPAPAVRHGPTDSPEQKPEQEQRGETPTVAPPPSPE